MINVNLGSETFQLKSKASELNLQELNILVQIMSNPNTVLTEKFELIFSVLGLPDNDLNADAMVELIKNFDVFKVKNNTPCGLINLKGYDYLAFDGENFKFKAKELILLEKEIQNNRIKLSQGKDPNNLVSFILAIIFKRVDLTNKEHYERVHIDLKQKLFEENVTAEFALPFINLVSASIFDLV